jgi:hypothetical protein
MIAAPTGGTVCNSGSCSGGDWSWTRTGTGGGTVVGRAWCDPDRACNCRVISSTFGTAAACSNLNNLTEWAFLAQFGGQWGACTADNCRLRCSEAFRNNQHTYDSGERMLQARRKLTYLINHWDAEEYRVVCPGTPCPGGFFDLTGITTGLPQTYWSISSVWCDEARGRTRTSCWPDW